MGSRACGLYFTPKTDRWGRHHSSPRGTETWVVSDPLIVVWELPDYGMRRSYLRNIPLGLLSWPKLQSPAWSFLAERSVSSGPGSKGSQTSLLSLLQAGGGHTPDRRLGIPGWCVPWGHRHRRGPPGQWLPLPKQPGQVLGRPRTSSGPPTAPSPSPAQWAPSRGMAAVHG